MYKTQKAQYFDIKIERKFQKKKSTARFINNIFFEKRLLRLSGRSVKKIMEEPVQQKLKTRNINSITVLGLIQIQNIVLSEYLLIDYPNLEKLRLFILQSTKKKMVKI